MTISESAVPTRQNSNVGRSLILAAAMVLALGGCFGETVIDTRSGDALRESIARISQDLAPKERKRFQAAVKVLVDAHKGDGRSTDEIAEILGPQIGGKTAADTIAAADAHVAAEKARLAEQERERQLKELAAKISEYSIEISRLELIIVEQAETANSVRSRLDLSDARYFWRESNAESYPVIDIEIANNHDRPIRTVVINARLMEADNNNPLVEGKLRYEFPSNLKPGSRTRMRLEPDIFGDWGNVALKDRDDLTLSVELENLTYPDGVELVRTFIVRGEDPEFKVKSLRRRKAEAQAELEALQGQNGNS